MLILLYKRITKCIQPKKHMPIQDLELVALIRIVILDELKEPLDLPDNTVCYVDDISIPQTSRTVESHNNDFYIISKMMYLAGGGDEMTEENNYNSHVSTLPEGSYTGPQMATVIQELLNGFAVTFDFEVVYHPARGSIAIEAKPEGMDSQNKFYIPNEFGIMTWMNSTDSDYPWRDRQGIITTVEIKNPKSINGVLRNSGTIAVNLESEYYRSYESGLIDLLNAHKVYLHCPNLVHFNSIGVKGENTIAKKVSVSPSFGYLIIDSVVAP